MRSVFAAAWVGVTAVCLAAGCNGLFGINDGVLAGDSGSEEATGGGDGGGDVAEAGTPDHVVPSEASGDVNVPPDAADAGPLQSLTCTTWRYAQPFMVANLAAYAGTCAGNYGGVYEFSSDASTVRIVAARCNSPVLFTVYSVDKTQSPPAVTSVDFPYGGTFGSVWSVTRIAGGFGVVAATTSSNVMTVDLYPFLDANPITPLPQPVPIAQLTESSTVFQRNVSVLQVSSSAYFVATDSDSTGTSGEFFSIGLASGGQPANLIQRDTLSILFDPVLAHVGSNVFIYVAQQPDALFYEVPDTATTGSMSKTLVPVGLSSAAYVLDTVPGSAPNTTNLAYEELDSTDAGQFGAAVFRASPVANATLPSLTGADIANGTSYTDIGSAPFSNAGIHLFGDDFVALGPGFDANQDPTQWINFLWLNVNGVVRGSQSGLNGLLSGHGPTINYITASPSGAFTPTSGAWNVAWAEPVAVDGGSYAGLFLNELDCK